MADGKKGLRPYQAEAVKGLMGFMQHCPDRAGLVCIPTGGGKSLILAEVIRQVCSPVSHTRVLMLCPRRELVSQNAAELFEHWSGADIGIYSAGLGIRQLDRRVTVASVQSLYRKAEALPPQTLVLIDEAHGLRADGEGMFNKILAALREKNPAVRVAGATATPYRLTTGLLTEDSGIFTDIVYEVGILDLIKQGYLSPLKSKAAMTEADLSGVTTRGGEYVQSEMEAAFDIDGLTRSAVGEMQVFGADRKSWLVFAAGVKHAANVARVMNEEGISAEYITGATPGEDRSAIIERFKRQQVQALISCETLTTGFNARCVDMVVLLRATKSPGLLVQMLGRGTRLSPETGKKDCVVLDFSGSIAEIGPIDAIRIRKNRKAGTDPIERVPTKTCPECRTILAAHLGECADCGHVFTRLTVPHEATAGTAPIFSEDVRPEIRGVTETEYTRHEKEGKRPSMRARYKQGKFSSVSEWVCFEHEGFPRKKAVEWWRRHGGQEPVPGTVEEALSRVGELFQVSEIGVIREGKYERVVSVTLREEREAPPVVWVPPTEDDIEALFASDVPF